MLYVSSGRRRGGDFAECLQGTVHVVCIDILLGGDAHDLRLPHVGEAVIAAASSTRCVGILLSPECKTWSAVHFLPDRHGAPGQPRRDAWNMTGIKNADGTVPSRVSDSNTVISVCAKSALAVGERGLPVIAETPAPRGKGLNGTTGAWPTDALTGAEAHCYMFDHPAWVNVKRKLGAIIVVFDMCRFADEVPLAAEKATALLASPPIAEAVRRTFADTRCDHPKGTHRALRGASGAMNNTAHSCTARL